MIHINVSLPDQVAQRYYDASEKLANYIGDPAPDAQTLMRCILAEFSADDVARHFDLALRNVTGAPMPDEAEVYVFGHEPLNAS